MSAPAAFDATLLDALKPARIGEAGPVNAVTVGAAVNAAGQIFSEYQIEFLASRHLVWMTETEREYGRGGTVIAAAYEEAVSISRRRGHGETVIGLMGASFLSNMEMWLRAHTSWTRARRW